VLPQFVLPQFECRLILLPSDEVVNLIDTRVASPSVRSSRSAATVRRPAKPSTRRCADHLASIALAGIQLREPGALPASWIRSRNWAEPEEDMGQARSRRRKPRASWLVNFQEVVHSARAGNADVAKPPFSSVRPNHDRGKQNAGGHYDRRDGIKTIRAEPKPREHWDSPLVRSPPSQLVRFRTAARMLHP
jgi:hypothetical protein